MKFLLLTALFCLSAFADVDPSWVEIHGNGIYTTSQKDEAYRRQKAFEKDLKNGDPVAMADRANIAMRAIFKIAVFNLKRHGYYADANEVEAGWRQLDGELVRLVKTGSRNIGDFAPWSNQLAVLYLIIEAKLGYQLCFTLRISDLATYIWTPPVVFHPCVYGHTEFMLHFAANDPKYRSFLPTTAYWTTSITCSISTFGVGYFFVCSPLGMLVELGTEKVLAPKLGDFIYERACTYGGGNSQM